MNYILTAQGITLSYDGNFTTISKGDHRYPDLIEAVKELAAKVDELSK